MTAIRNNCPNFTRRDSIGSLVANGLCIGGLCGNPVNSAGSHQTKIKARKILMLFASGGQSQFETWDPKPHAPMEIRGAFGTIGTSTIGLRVCEHLPKLAALSNMFCVFRSMSHDDIDHGTASYLTLTGRRHKLKSSNPNPAATDHPCLAAAFSRVSPSKKIPFSSVNINGPMLIPITPGPGQDGGFLGNNSAPALIGDPSANIVRSWALADSDDIPSVRIDGRRILAGDLDRFRSTMEANPPENGWDHQVQKAYSLLKSTQFRKAFDLEKEKAGILARYGSGRTGRACLMGRKLIEAGVPWVTVFLNHSIRGQDEHENSHDWFGWDTHNDIFETLKTVLLPRFDTAVSALLEDMNSRNLLNDTMVVVVGEFGRAPLVATEKRFSGSSPGRKHWAGAYSMIAFGAGIPGGRVIGDTDKWGASVQSHRATPEDLAATLFDSMGVDPSGTFTDLTGRVISLSEGKPIRTLWEG